MIGIEYCKNTLDHHQHVLLPSTQKESRSYDHWASRALLRREKLTCCPLDHAEVLAMLFRCSSEKRCLIRAKNTKSLGLSRTRIFLLELWKLKRSKSVQPVLLGTDEESPAAGS